MSDCIRCSGTTLIADAPTQSNSETPRLSHTKTEMLAIQMLGRFATERAMSDLSRNARESRGDSGRFAGARYNDATMPTVDYRMARRALLRDLRSGLRSVADVCDAHPELMRAARFIGEETAESCPICGHQGLRVLFYTYGKELKGRENGRVRRRADLMELRQRFGEFACYVVEVCTECSWNHLVRSYLSGYKHAG